jgi:hypothetical protein
MKRLTVLSASALVAFALTCAEARAQRPRVTPDQPVPAPTETPAPPPAPATVKAKYEGGVTGFMKKQTGTLNFNDAEQRLVFRDKYQREYFSLPYKALAAIWPDTKAQRTTAGRVVSAIPAPYGANLIGLLMREKLRYLVVQYSDPDTEVQGVTSFKLDNKELLASVLHTLAGKAELKPRGEAFVRAKDAADGTNSKTPTK